MTTTIYAAETGRTYPMRAALYVQSCITCGMLFGVDDAYDNRRREDHQDFYCPNGHAQHYTGKPTAQQERDQAIQERDAARRRADQAEEAAGFQRRRAAALRGHLTRMRNRIAQGVCPVPGCHRSGFSRVKAHIASKHPEWHAEHAGDLR